MVANVVKTLGRIEQQLAMCEPTDSQMKLECSARLEYCPAPDIAQAVWNQPVAKLRVAPLSRAGSSAEKAIPKSLLSSLFFLPLW